jgi:Phosphotransferase enzyme family
VQEELPGEPLGGWEVPLPTRLYELNDLQEGHAVDDDRSWPETLVESVVDGFEEFMILETLERHSPEGRELLALCRGAVERNAGVVAVADDVVHMDFTAANVLGADGEVTGVIDWGGTRSGDRAFDLATWFYYSPRTCRDDLLPLLIERVGSRGLSVYLAHLAIRQAEWSVRLHGTKAGWAMVRYGLELARAFP